MDAGLIAFIAGMIGLLVGVLSMNAVARSERERERSLVSAPTLRDGAAQVLAVIGRAYLVIDEVGEWFRPRRAPTQWAWCAGTRSPRPSWPI